MFAPSSRAQTASSVGRSGVTVLGIDPGLTRCGFAVLLAHGARQPEIVSLGVITTKATSALWARLAELRLELSALFDEFSPQAVAVERVFFQRNVRTAMSVAQVSGLALAIAAERGCEVVQYTPTQVKAAVAGWGGADKAQMQRMVQKRLGLSSVPKPADAADAAALALCYLAVLPLQKSISSAVKKPATP